MITIAIDGYAGTGKSSTAREVARRLGFTYIDTGAMYRAVTLYFLNQGLQPTASENVLEEALNHIQLDFVANDHQNQLRIHLNGECVEPDIRKPAVTNLVSQVAAIPAVRHKLVEQQRNIGRHGSVVMDGRDIGTYVFPDAELKVFMTASMETRARRRAQELKEKGIDIHVPDIIDNLKQRDYIDSHREMAPLQQSEDAIVIDTTNLSFDNQVEQVVLLARTLIDKGRQP